MFARLTGAGTHASVRDGVLQAVGAFLEAGRPALRHLQSGTFVRPWKMSVPVEEDSMFDEFGFARLRAQLSLHRARGCRRPCDVSSKPDTVVVASSLLQPLDRMSSRSSAFTVRWLTLHCRCRKVLVIDFESLFCLCLIEPNNHET